MKTPQPTSCYCGRLLPYVACCGKVHHNINMAKTAEDLMRSRYSAYVLGLGDYLMISHHFSTRPINEKQDIEHWAKAVKWKKLEIVSTNLGAEQDDEGYVEFVATFKEKGRTKTIEEHSKFVRENGHWVYLGYA